MRIVSGSRRGHKLIEFDGMDIRPTTDRVKESLFNLIQEYLPESIVLDLFSGTGALAFEALSRGAKFATCVDIESKSIEVIKKNLNNLKFENIEIVNKNALDFLEGTNRKYSLIFLDPPYNKGFIEPIIASIIDNHILSDNGIIALESDFSDEHGDFRGLNKIKQKKYGRTYVTVYQRG